MSALTRKKMEEIVREGGSISYKGEIIKEIRKLPSEAELAGTDTNRQVQAKSNLEAELERVQAELAILKTQGSEESVKAAKAAAAKVSNESDASKPEINSGGKGNPNPPVFGDGDDLSDSSPVVESSKPSGSSTTAPANTKSSK